MSRNSRRAFDAYKPHIAVCEGMRNLIVVSETETR